MENEGSPVEEEKKASPSELDEMTTLHERTLAALSYIGPLCVIPLFLNKESRFCRFHGKQGLLLFILFFLAQLFAVLDLVQDALFILQVIIFFYMGLAALSGRWTKLPFIYETADKLEQQLQTKNKEEENKEAHFKPDETPSKEAGDSSKNNQ
ncbi:hypothetical protein IPJ72_03305 [Candidatus Peregrinibacteria bacterium]|nr:MAG: hypothetical protein IPJ72_03305 [Candidatus Peregrinibacteria bacterium]